MSDDFSEFLKTLTDLELVSLIKDLRTFPEDDLRQTHLDLALLELRQRAKQEH